MKKDRYSCNEHYRQMEDRIHLEMLESEDRGETHLNNERPELWVGVKCEICDELRAN